MSIQNHIKQFYNQNPVPNPINLTLTEKQAVNGQKIDDLASEQNLRHFRNLINTKLYKNAYKRHRKQLSMFVVREIPIAKEGMNRTIYSLRHFYGTQRLRGNINPYILAKNMGTSVEMIEKFYGHILTPDIVSSIKKTTSQSSPEQSKGSYPF